MQRTSRWLVIVALSAGLLGALTSAAPAAKGKEKQKKTKKAKKAKKAKAPRLEKIPELARARILNEAGKNKVEKIEAEKEDGQVFYEGEWTVDGKEVEVKVTADGRLVEKETEVSLDDVPAAVRATILKEAGKAKVKEVEQVVAGKMTFYEAEWEAGDKDVEIEVAPDGKLLKKEVEEEDDDDDEGDDDDGDGDDGDDDDDDEDDEDEEDVSLDDVPAAVRATILKQAGKNKIHEIEKETKNGKVVYEAEWKVGGKEIEIKVAPDGKLLKKEVEDEDDDDDDGDDDGDDDDDEDDEDEEDVSLDDVPAAVRATILKHAGRNKIHEIEKETKNGKVVYEAEWKVGGKEIEIKVAPDGKLLKKEVEDDDDDD